MLVAPAQAQLPVEPEVLHENLPFPAGIAFAGDGSMYFTERGGAVRVVRNGGLDPEPLASASTTTDGERGFLGIAVSPATGDIFVFATDPSGTSNSILRVPSSGGELEPVITGLPGGGYHNGGGIAFTRSGEELFISNGEIHDSVRAQDPEQLGGKVYRVTPEGDPISDNPFGGGSTTYALGLRNPFGLAIDPVSGNPFVTENGPSSNDEINHIVAGGNYGWPALMGAVEDVGDAEATLEGTYRDPLLDYPDIIVPTGIAFAHPRNAQRQYAGDLFFGTYGERSVHRVRLDEDRSVISDSIFLQETDPVIALAWGPRGLYYSTPSAIKLLPLARGRQVSEESPEGRTGPVEPGLRLDRIAVALGVVVLLGIGLALWGRKKKGRTHGPTPFLL